MRREKRRQKRKLRKKIDIGDSSYEVNLIMSMQVGELDFEDRLTKQKYFGVDLNSKYLGSEVENLSNLICRKIDYG